MPLAKQLMKVDLIHVQLKKAYTPRQLYGEFMAALSGIYGGGKANKRGIEYRTTTSLAIMLMLFDASAKYTLPESIRMQCESLRKLSMSVVQIQMSSLKTFILVYNTNKAK